MPPLPSDIRSAQDRLRAADRRRRLRLLLGGTLASLGTVAAAAAVVAIVLAANPSLRAPGGQSPVAVAGSMAASASVAPTTFGAETSPGPAPACAPGDLEALATAWGAAAGSRGTAITVTNRSLHACRLMGRPGASVSSGADTLVRVAPDAGTGASVELVAGASATTSVVWSNWCGADPSGALVVDLWLGQARLAVEPDASTPQVLVPPCMGSDPTSLSTIDFQQP